MYGFSSLVCLLSNTAFTAYPEMKAVLVVSPSPIPGMRVLWLGTAIKSGLTHCWRNGKQTCTESSQLILDTSIVSSKSARIVIFQK